MRRIEWNHQKKEYVDNFIRLDYWPIENGLLMFIAIFQLCCICFDAPINFRLSQFKPFFTITIFIPFNEFNNLIAIRSVAEKKQDMNMEFKMYSMRFLTVMATFFVCCYSKYNIYWSHGKVFFFEPIIQAIFSYWFTSPKYLQMLWDLWNEVYIEETSCDFEILTLRREKNVQCSCFVSIEQIFVSG